VEISAAKMLFSEPMHPLYEILLERDPHPIPER
jgi:hypothetical protein